MLKSAAFCGKRGVDLQAAMVREQLLSNAAVREEEQRETPAAPPETRPALRARPRMGRYTLLSALWANGKASDGQSLSKIEIQGK